MAAANPFPRSILLLFHFIFLFFIYFPFSRRVLNEGGMQSTLVTVRQSFSGKLEPRCSRTAGSFSAGTDVVGVKT